MAGKKILKKNKDMVSRVVDDELILVPLFKTDDDINSIYTLNNVAAKIWEFLDGGLTREELNKKVLEYFDVKPDVAKKSVGEFIKDLKEIKAIEK